MIQLALVLLAQNIVEGGGADVKAEPVKLDAKDVEMIVRMTPTAVAMEGRVAEKLRAHIDEFIDGFPYLPFHVTHGISGYEAFFDHPDRMFYALSFSPGPKVCEFLAQRLKDSPPYAVEGFDRTVGRPRESYAVPPELRLKGRGRAKSAFGVYAFWEYCHRLGDLDAAKSHWPAVKARMNGADDLAGMIGFARLARMNEDAETERRALGRIAELLEARVNLDRVNARILEKTDTTTQRLHAMKLARYGDLIPPVAEALRTLTEGCASKRLKAFREERNGWWMAFGDRYIGGENYTSPPHLSHALFVGAAQIEQLDGKALLEFVDVPWCKGDFYFIEKCALALWAASGRPWTKL